MVLDVEAKTPGDLTTAVLATGATTTPTATIDPAVITPTTSSTIVLNNFQLAKVSSAYISLGFGHNDTLASITEGNPTSFTLTGSSSGITNGETFGVILAGITQDTGAALDINGSYPSTGKGRASATGANTFTIPVDTSARTYDVSAATVIIIREQIYTEQATLAVSNLRGFTSSSKKLYVLGDGAADGRSNISAETYQEIARDEAVIPPPQMQLRFPQKLIRSNGAIVTANSSTVYRTLYQLGANETMTVTRVGVMRGGTNEITVGYADDAAGTNFVVILGTRGADHFADVRAHVPAGKFILVKNIEAGGSAKIGCGYFEGELGGKPQGFRVSLGAVTSADGATVYSTLNTPTATEARVVDRLVLLNLDLDELSIGYADDAAGTNFVAFRWTGTASAIVDDSGKWVVPAGKFILLRANSSVGEKWGSGWIDSYRTA